MNDYEHGCIFCDIGRGLVEPQTRVQRMVHAYVMEPLNPVTPGHLLVIPYSHTPDFAADPQTAAAVMGSAALFVKSTDYGQCNLITSKGVDATQSVFHLHIHIVPRKAGDYIALPWDGIRRHEVPPPEAGTIPRPEGYPGR